MPSRSASRSGVRSPDESSSLSIVVDSPPGRTIASTPASCSGVLTSVDVGAERVERLRLLAKRALQRENTDLHLAASASRTAHQPRSASFTSSVPISSPRHRLAETARHLGHDVGVGVVRGGLDDRARALRGIATT